MILLEIFCFNSFFSWVSSWKSGVARLEPASPNSPGLQLLSVEGAVEVVQVPASLWLPFCTTTLSSSTRMRLASLTELTRCGDNDGGAVGQTRCRLFAFSVLVFTAERSCPIVILAWRARARAMETRRFCPPDYKARSPSTVRASNCCGKFMMFCRHRRLWRPAFCSGNWSTPNPMLFPIESGVPRTLPCGT